MYLVLKCNYIDEYHSIVLAAELVTSVPSYVTYASDYVYCPLTDMSDEQMETYMKWITQQIGNLYFRGVPKNNLAIAVSQRTNKIYTLNAREARKLTDNEWNSSVRPAWVRAATVVNLFNA